MVSRLVPMPIDAVRSLQSAVGHAVFTRVAGPDGLQARDRIHGAEGERWFDPASPIGTVHGDASMYIGGLRALLLQALHPLAMAGVADHSGFMDDPWGRLQRTATFLATTTFGTIAEAERTIDRVRRVHEHIRGTDPEGTPYAASDPHLLRWVHVAEVDSFLRAHDVYGARRLDPEQRDEYVAQASLVAERLGATGAPTSAAELADQLAAYRPELRSTPAARQTARYLLLRAPIPIAFRPPYAVLGAAAVGLLPRWARLPLRLPYLPVAEATVVRAAGHSATFGLRWVSAPLVESGPAGRAADAAADPALR